MVLISEWFPNPVGSDAEGEWVELTNTALFPVNIRRWSIEAGAGKRFVFRDGTIAPGGYRVVERSESRLTLRNSGDTLILRDAEGNITDTARLYGEAPEGQSMNRVSGRFVFGTPTPGAANSEVVAMALMSESVPSGGYIRGGIDPADVFGILLGVSALLVAATFVIVKYNNALSELFFEKY